MLQNEKLPLNIGKMNIQNTCTQGKLSLLQFKTVFTIYGTVFKIYAKCPDNMSVYQSIRQTKIYICSTHYENKV